MDSRKLKVNFCGCEKCQTQGQHAEKHLHMHVNLLLSRLNEKQRRWLAALLAEQLGLSRGGVRQVSKICGMSEKTIRRGLKELDNNFLDMPVGRVRRAGAGRPAVRKESAT